MTETVIIVIMVVIITLVINKVIVIIILQSEKNPQKMLKINKIVISVCFHVLQYPHFHERLFLHLSVVNITTFPVTSLIFWEGCDAIF